MGTRSVTITDMAIGETLLIALNPFQIRHIHDPLPPDTKVKDTIYNPTTGTFLVLLESERWEGNKAMDVNIERSVEEIPTFTVEIVEVEA